MQYAIATERGSVSVLSGAPSSLGPGQVRVDVAFVGVCHSDLAKVREGEGAFPERMGHELAGVVRESHSVHFKPGDRVAVYVFDGYATEVVASEDHVIPVDPRCSLLDAALAEPLACVIGGVEMLELTDASELCVVGAGFMGLMAIRYLSLVGHDITVIEPRENARAAAITAGASRVLDPSSLPEGLAFDTVIEATGVAPGLRLAGDLVTIGGALGIMGYHQSDEGLRNVNMQSWNFRGLKVLSLHHRDPQKVMRWMSRAQRSSAGGGIRPSALVDHVIALDDLPAYFANPAHGIKTVVSVQPPVGEIADVDLTRSNAGDGS